MPFQEIQRMHSRKKMIQAIADGQSIAQAAREAGVSRPTAYTWLKRSHQEGFQSLHEHSRRPQRHPHQTPDEQAAPLLRAKAAHPGWGAKKLLWWLEQQGRPVPFCLRTADRILARAGLTNPRQAAAPAATVRFEQAAPNEMWQMDFKGLGKPSLGYLPLSVLDDHSRYVLAFEPLEHQTSEAVFEQLWRLFGEYGLPRRILSDNGPCFAGAGKTGAGTSSLHSGPSRLEVKLWLLGIDTTHGRPYHPQTQGKVERFHRTIAIEADSRGQSLRAPDVTCARRIYAPLVELYNWSRPHEALAMQTPGMVYSASQRPRPAQMPTHELPESALKRKVCASGKICFGGQLVRVGSGLAGQWVQVEEQEQGWVVRFAGKIIAQIAQQPVEK